jgi:DNA-binding transcriptional LysR family regulator
MIETPDLRFFVAIATSPSLAAAARTLNVSPSAVSQRLSHIEQRLGLRLIERGRGHLVLTSEGETLLRRSAEILNDLAVLNEDMRTHRHEISGPLRIIAPFGFGRIHVAPVIANLVRTYPDIAPDLILSDDPYGAARTDNWDMIVHIGKLADSTLTQKKLAPNRRFLCASPDYLARAGIPERLEDLHHHACGVIREDQADVTMWSVTGAKGEQHALRIRPTFSSNDGEVIKSWAIAGMGIVQRSEWNVAADVAAGRLTRVLPSLSLPDADIVALLNPGTLRTARVQHVLDALTAHLSSHLS